MKMAKEVVLDPVPPKDLEALLAKRFLDPKGELTKIKKDAGARRKQISDLVTKINKDPDLKSALSKNPLDTFGDALGPYDTLTIDLQPKLGKFRVPQRECSYVYTWEERVILFQGRPLVVMAHVLKQVCIWL
jgi:hypothetical protein